MKLLDKTNRTYLLLSGTAFIIAGVVTYLVISLLLKEQLNEKLLSDIEDVKRTIATTGVLPEYYPFIETREVPELSPGSYKINDTLIFNAQEEGTIEFRQISLVCSVNGKNYFIAARNELFENSDLISSIILVIGSVLILLLISLYLINRRLSIHLWRPFYKTLHELREFSYDTPGFIITGINQSDEFMELNKTLDKLTQKVISDYQSLKRFTEDASHEIQTPLAIVQSKLEALLQYPDLKEDQAEVINSAYVSVLRISKLTRTLLLLTKIANDQFPEKTEVNISQLIDNQIRFFEDHIRGKSITLFQEIDRESFLSTNFLLAESMISNLIGNAVKHCNTGGKINIVLKTSQFEISNSGDPLPVQSSKLFERFYKVNKSSDSQGLGLSIVQEICLLNKWEISYDYQNGMHKFIVKF